jgi:hypothetical protein
MASPVDIYVLYRIIKDLSTPFDETKAFELGLIDKNGKRLKKANTSDEKKAMGYYDKFVFNIKRLLGKIGLDSKLATFAGAIFLLREQSTYNQNIAKYQDILDESLLEESVEWEKNVLSGILAELEDLSRDNGYKFKQLQEEIANATGSAVAGTGSDGVHWAKAPGMKVGLNRDKRKYGRYINGTTFLKRVLKRKKDTK